MNCSIQICAAYKYLLILITTAQLFPTTGYCTNVCIHIKVTGYPRIPQIIFKNHACKIFVHIVAKNQCTMLCGVACFYHQIVSIVFTLYYNKWNNSIYMYSYIDCTCKTMWTIILWNIATYCMYFVRWQALPSLEEKFLLPSFGSQISLAFKVSSGKMVRM